MRARSLAGIALGLLSLVIGWRARKKSSAGVRGSVRTGVIVGLVFGIVSIALSFIHLNITSGAGFGSGSGKAGAI